MKKYTVAVGGAITGEEITMVEGVVEAVKIPLSLFSKTAAPVDAQIAAMSTLAGTGLGYLFGESHGHRRAAAGKRAFIMAAN